MPRASQSHHSDNVLPLSSLSCACPSQLAAPGDYPDAQRSLHGAGRVPLVCPAPSASLQGAGGRTRWSHQAQPSRSACFPGPHLPWWSAAPSPGFPCLSRGGCFTADSTCLAAYKFSLILDLHFSIQKFIPFNHAINHPSLFTHF